MLASPSTRAEPATPASLSEEEILDLCLSLRRHDLALTEEQQRASEFYARTHARRFALVMNRLAPLLPQGARIFSVGSMPNQLELLFARFLQADVVGSTYSPRDKRNKFTAVYEQSGGWRHAMDVYLRDLTRDALPAESRSCDAVLCFEVVEHFQQSPLSLFREINRVLKPDGHLLLSTPNMQHWHRVLYLLNGMTYPDVDFAEPIESRHRHIFSFHELQELLRIAGLEVVTHFFADPWDNAKHHAQFDDEAPLHKAVLGPLAERDEFRYECTFVAARPAEGLPRLTNGWHGVERSGSDWWCWTPGRGEIRIPSPRRCESRLQGQLYSIQHPNNAEIAVNGNRVATIDVTWDSFGEIPPVALPLEAGENVVEIASRNPALTPPNDDRLLAVAVKNLTLRLGDHEWPVLPPRGDPPR
ncbi:MAG TPA: class I SAM-dependent methyltransferase [Verrucomicrobiae bacterium]|nr:class I SAM-dependent methyltransferase [Verrucomicrobiae bacterium]